MKKKNNLKKFFDYLTEPFYFGLLAGAGLIFLLELAFQFITNIFSIIAFYKEPLFLLFSLILIIYSSSIIKDAKLFKIGFLCSSLLIFLGFLINWIFFF